MTTDVANRDDLGNELAVYNPPDFRAVLAENLGPDETLGLGDLIRVSVPNDRESFEVDYGDGKEPVKTIKGVIAHHQRNRRYYVKDYDSSATEPPDCYSPDGVRGYGDNGTINTDDEAVAWYDNASDADKARHSTWYDADGALVVSAAYDCDTCPLNKWGSAPARRDGTQSRGKACAERVDLYVLRERGVLPLVIGAPPTSLTKLRRYMLRLADRELPFFAVETEIGLEPGAASSELTFRRVRNLDEDSIAKVETYREGVAAVVSADEQRRATAGPREA